MIPSEADAFKYALCMDLRQDGFRFSFIDPKTKEVTFFKSIDFDSVDEASLLTLLEEPYFKYDYQSVSIAVSTARHTIVPDAIFNASKPKDIFALNHSEPIDNLDYRRLPELGLVSVYEIPLWMKSVFVKRFLRAKINHHSTVLLKGVFSTSNYKPKAYVLKESNLFYLVMTDKNKLIYFNLFESNAVADLVYYYLFTVEQKGFDPAVLPLTVYGLEEGDKAYKELKSLMSSPLEFPNDEHQQQQYVLTNLLLCV